MGRAFMFGAIAITSAPLMARADEPQASPALSPSDKAGAELLFDEGRKLMDAQSYAEACAKLEASERLEPAVGTLLNLGECHERQAHLATAWGYYREAYSMAHARGDAVREHFAKERAAAIEGRVAKLVIAPRDRTPGLVITRDGIPVESGAWGTPLPVDAGAHVIEARAPQKRPWRGEVQATSGAAIARVDVPLLEDDVSASPPPAQINASTVVDAPKHQGGLGVQRGVAIAAAGLGLVAIGVGTFFGLHARAIWSDARSHCDPANACDTYGFDRNQEARRQGDLATLTTALGGAAVASGVVLWLMAPKRGAAVSATVVPLFARDGGGVAWRATF